MEPIFIILIILIASTIGKAIRKGRGSKSRREVPDSPEKTPDRSSSVKKKEDPPRWPGADQYTPFPERESFHRESKKDRTGTSTKTSDRDASKKRYPVDQRKRDKREKRVTPGELLKDRKDLKRGIILKEVLGKPKSREMMQKYSQ